MNLKNSQDRSKYCYYCGAPITKDEIKRTDFEMKNIYPEEREFVIDELKRLKTHNSEDIHKNHGFIHEINKNVRVFNVCMNCFKIAYGNYLSSL